MLLDPEIISQIYMYLIREKGLYLNGFHDHTQMSRHNKLADRATNEKLK